MMTVQQLVARDATREQIEDWARQHTQSYSGSDHVICRVLGKFVMQVDPDDDSLAPHLVLNGIWEPWVTMAIVRHVKSGMRCLDVGACYGYFSLLMADIAGCDGYVEAWDPIWGGSVALNARMNGLRVKVRQSLMGTNMDALFEFKVPQGTMYNAGNVHLCPCGILGTLPRVRMDKPDSSAFDFIKIDVEGAEADVWEALAGVREQSPNLTVCMEFTPGKHADPEGFLAKLHADGFALGTVGIDGFPRPVDTAEALTPDTGDFRMLWLTRWR